jgi:hypothetical protein
MSRVTEQATSTRPGAAGREDELSRRHRGAWVVLVIVLAVAASGWFSWMTATQRAVDQVLVRWAHESPSCTGSRVRPGGVDPFEELAWSRAAIVAGPDMACTITVEILNGSEDAVHVGRLIAPMAGPGTRSVVMVDPEVHPQPDVDPLSSERLGDLDAVIDVDAVLDAGAETAVEVRLVFNPDGCIMGGTAYSDGWPTVELTTLRRTFERPAADTYAVFHRGRTPGCGDVS